MNYIMYIYHQKMKIKDYLIFFGMAFFPILLWIGIRFKFDGMAFLGQMFGVDVAERVTWPVSANEDGMFYIKYILNTNGGRLMLLAIVFSGVYLFLQKKADRKERKATICSPRGLAVALWVFITLITFSVTRADNYWYIFPLYPGLCVGAAFLLQRVADSTAETNKSRAVKAVLFLGAVITFFTALDTASGIKKLERSNYQLDLQRALETYPQFNGLKMYVEKNNNEYKESYYWEQAGILIAELSGDMKCEEGGVEAYLKEVENALIIVDNYFYEQYEAKFQESEVIYENEYIILKNFSE